MITNLGLKSDQSKRWHLDQPNHEGDQTWILHSNWGVRTDEFLAFTYDQLVARDKANLDITWLRDESLEDSANLPAPNVIAREIVEDLTAALAEFEAVASTLERRIDSE